MSSANSIIIIKIERELQFVEDIAKVVSTNIQSTPGETEESFYAAFAICRDQFTIQDIRLSQTSYINGVLRFLRDKLMIDSSDNRLFPCGPLLGVSHLSMKNGRENIVSLLSQHRALIYQPVISTLLQIKLHLLYKHFI